MFQTLSTCVGVSKKPKRDCELTFLKDHKSFFQVYPVRLARQKEYSTSMKTTQYRFMSLNAALVCFQHVKSAIFAIPSNKKEEIACQTPLQAFTSAKNDQPQSHRPHRGHKSAKNADTLLKLLVSNLFSGHANLLCFYIRLTNGNSEEHRRNAKNKRIYLHIIDSEIDLVSSHSFV